MRLCIRTIIFLIVICRLASASDTPSREEAVRQLQKAFSQPDIFALPSFSMKAKVQLNVRGELIDGTYQLLWNGPYQWREEASFPDYQEIQVGGKSLIWVKRSTDFVPLAMHNIHQALGFGSSAGTPPNESLVRLNLQETDKVKKVREKNKEKLSCTEFEDAKKIESEICVRENEGAIFRTGNRHIGTNFQSVGDKRFPRSLTFLYQGSATAKVNILEINNALNFSADAFNPPAGVSSKAGCMNHALAHLESAKCLRSRMQSFGRIA